jgi:hypothetical protein
VSDEHCQWDQDCPVLCGTVSDVHGDATFVLLETILGISGEYLVRGVACGQCGYEAVTSDAEEREKLRRASEIWRLEQEREITAENSATALDELGSELLSKIRQEGMTWRCEACGEKNGMSFLECWNCQHERRPADIGLD